MNKGVYNYPKGIFPKVNVIERLEFELAYKDSAVQRLNHYTTRTPRKKKVAVYFQFMAEFGV